MFALKKSDLERQYLMAKNTNALTYNSVGEIKLKTILGEEKSAPKIKFSAKVINSKLKTTKKEDKTPSASTDDTVLVG